METCTLTNDYVHEKVDSPVSKSTKAYPKISDLKDLIEALHVVFEDDHVNIEHVKELMLSYKSNEADWKKYAKFDRNRYTRNLVDKGNGKFNLIVLCWGEGHGSAIHDHADSHCFMKMLKGELEETRFAWPDAHDPNRTKRLPADDNEIRYGGDIGDSRWDVDESGMVELGRTRLATNSVCYINDSLGLHRVENPSNANTAVSLHLYSPPFDACHVFNQQTGHKTKAPVTFWSKFGEKRDREIQESRLPEDN
ncbi:cysteine dioxygenase type 1 [Arctopsyche grandis]|uniref:cysteine dioxygenase type 1 n=1 Tax=Arctopsyche grandis TaxID=121162 RepID=UPI00406D9D90